MAEARLVECPDCGHRWESRAKDPRCSDPDGVCGRSRAVEVDADGSPDGSSPSSDDVPDDRSGDDVESGTDDDGGRWSPLFETREERTGAGDGVPSRPTLDDDSESSDDDTSDEPEISADEFPELEAEDVRPFLITAFGGPPEKGDDPIPGYLSQQRGDHWAMKDHELDQLSRAYARVGNKYLPYLLAEYTVEGLALLTTAMVVAPRIQEDRRRAQEKAKRERERGKSGGSVRRGSESSSERSEESEDAQIEELAQGDESGGWQAGARA